MAIEIQCPDCRKRYRVKDELAGRTLPCKACGGQMKVRRPKPEPQPEPVYEDDAWNDDSGQDEAFSAAPPPRRKKSSGKSKGKGSTGKAAAVGGSILKRIGGVLALVIGGAIVVGGGYAIVSGNFKGIRAIITGFIFMGVGLGWLRGN